MNFEIQPYVGAGLIRIGMESKQVEEILNYIPEKFQKSPLSDVLTDGFPFCHVYYKEDERCEAIEFFEPAKVTFQGNSLLDKTYSNIRKLFQELDDDIEEDDAGLISFKYGISIYSSDLENVESVLVFEKGYYE